ncbi:MAG: squalene--hopene cyclase [Pseudomonadota bacterium]
MDERAIGIVCGLQSEAKAVHAALEGEAYVIGVSGADAARAEAIAHEFCQQGAGIILSVGVSGGLSPSLEPGSLLVTDYVCDGAGLIESVDPKFLTMVREYPARPLIFGADDIVASAEEKARLFERTKAIAVDMESHGAARAARTAEVPFLAIRAIADPADRALPPAAMNAVAPDGSTRVIQTLLECVKAPGQFPALLQLGSDSEKALKTLRQELLVIFKAIRESL